MVNLLMPNEAELSIPLAKFDELLDVRTKRYVLCLGMVHLIVERELKTNCDIQLFRQIGIVASFIDEQLDDLNLNEKQDLLVSFDWLYKQLKNTTNYIQFKSIVCNYVEEHDLKFNCNEFNIRELYLFIDYCNQNNLSNILGNFGKEIITCSILKQQATSTSKIRQLLKKEGELVCSLLENLLTKNHSKNPSFRNTIAFLVQCEQILNLADDSIDALEDKSKNNIQVHNGTLHAIKMLGYLLNQIAKTAFYYPLKFTYYTPTLIGYFLRHR